MCDQLRLLPTREGKYGTSLAGTYGPTSVELMQRLEQNRRRYAEAFASRQGVAVPASQELTVSAVEKLDHFLRFTFLTGGGDCIYT